MKLARAREHFIAVEQVVSAWNQANPVLAPMRRCPDSTRQVELFRPDMPYVPVMYWSSFVGDGVHNLRAAFDALAFELCHLDGAAPRRPRRVYFPARRSTESEWARDTRDLASMPPSILERLRALQVWSQPEAPGGHGHTLALIHELDLQDKHRSLITVDVVPGRLTADTIKAWPEWLDPQGAFTSPWTRITVDRDLPAGLQPGVWEVPVAPFLVVGDVIAPLFEAQRHLLRAAYRILTFVAEGEEPTAADESEFCSGYEPTTDDGSFLAALSDAIPHATSGSESGS